MSRAPVRTRYLAEEEHAAWDRLVAASPLGSAYSTTAYLSALCDATGGSFRILAAERGEELVGGVALYERDTPLGPFVSPRLLLYYNGIVARGYETRYPSERAARELELLGALANALERTRYGRLELRSRSPLVDARVFAERGWSTTLSYTYVVDLRDLDGQWSRVEQNLRRLVSRSESEGLEVTEDDDFDAYFRLHARTHERKGAPLYLPHGRYAAFYSRLRAAGLCRLYHARIAGGRSVASQLVLVAHPVTHTVSASTDADFARLGATPFLRWRVFEDLARHGHVANDLTDAVLGSVSHFKGQLGGSLEPCLVVARRESLRFRLARGARRLARAGTGGRLAR